MGRECDVFVGEEKCTEGVGRKTWKKRDILGDLDLCDNILLKLIWKEWNDVDFIDRTQDRYKWRVTVITVINMLVA
jgi:hypothetical protein